MFKAAVSLAEQLNITIDGQPIGWQAIDTDGDIISALEHTCFAMATTNIAGIVGPELSHEAHAISYFARTIGIPVISYAATDSDLSSRRMYPTFYRTVPSDSSAAMAIVKLFQRYKWTSCILIHQNDAFGSTGARVIEEAFGRDGMAISARIIFDVATRTIQGDLAHLLLSSASRVIILWADSAYTSTILQQAAEQNLIGPMFLWILSGSIPLNNFNESLSRALIGMLSIEPMSRGEIDANFNQSLLNAAYEMWKRHEPESFPGKGSVDPYALFAFDATWLLIQSLQQLCPQTINELTPPCLSFSNSPFCFGRRLVNFTSLLERISAAKFLGVSGPIEYHANGADRIRGIHFVVRNAQPSLNGVTFMSVLKYSEPREWELLRSSHDMVWPGRSFIAASDRATIAGIRVRIGIIESPAFMTVTYVIDEHGQNKSHFVGYIPDLIHLLQARMKFIPVLDLARPEQSYSNLIQAVVQGDYDFVVSDMTVTSARRSLVTFSTSIFDNSLRLIIRKPKIDQVALLSHLGPFSLRLWMLILATTICTSVLLCLVERHHNETLRHRSMLSIEAMSLWYSVGNIMGYGADFHVTTISGRMSTVALYILSLVLVASYTANLASNLTAFKAKYIIKSIDEMKQGKLPHNRIGVRVNSVAEDFFLREIAGGSRKYYRLHSRQELLKGLLNGDIDVSFMDSGRGEYLTNSIYCNLTLIGPSFDANTFGIVFPKNWLYIDDFDINILALRESGELDKLRRRWFGINYCEVAEEKPNAMGVDSMFGLLLTVGIIVFVAILTLAWTKRMAIQNSLQTIQGRG